MEVRITIDQSALGKSALWIQLKNNYSAPQLGTINSRFAKVQLELGDVATEFEVKPKADSLAVCQRFAIPLVAIVDFSIMAVPVSMISANFAMMTIPLPVFLRDVPVIQGNFDFIIQGGGINDTLNQSDLSAIALRSSGISISINTASSLVATNAYTGYLENYADTMISAEL